MFVADVVLTFDDFVTDGTFDEIGDDFDEWGEQAAEPFAGVHRCVRPRFAGDVLSPT